MSEKLEGGGEEQEKEHEEEHEEKSKGEHGNEHEEEKDYVKSMIRMQQGAVWEASLLYYGVVSLTAGIRLSVKGLKV